MNRPGCGGLQRHTGKLAERQWGRAPWGGGLCPALLAEPPVACPGLAAIRLSASYSCLALLARCSPDTPAQLPVCGGLGDTSGAQLLLSQTVFAGAVCGPHH